jgi:hypothetical protein
MKNIIIITLCIFSFLSCKAQNITPIYNEDEIEIFAKAYYKDVDNDLDPYAGKWKWEDGNNSLEIIFNKIVHNDEGDGNFSDDLVGEYKYIENGAVLVDSFDPLMLDEPNGVPNIVIPNNNSIVSYDIRTDNRGLPPCPECAPNTRFVFLAIQEKTKSGIYGMIRMARFIEGGIEKIRMRITNTYGPTNLSIPENSIWTLTKVE